MQVPDNYRIPSIKVRAKKDQRSMGYVHTATMREVRGSSLRSATQAWATTLHTNKLMCEKISIISARCFATRLWAVSHIWWSGSRQAHERSFHRTAGGEERKERQCCSWDLTLGPGDRWSRSWHSGNAEAVGLWQSVRPAVAQPAVGMNFKTPRGAFWIFQLCCNIFNKL